LSRTATPFATSTGLSSRDGSTSTTVCSSLSSSPLYLLKASSTGAYGAPPNEVVAAMREIQDEISSAPDIFMKSSYPPRLDALRGRLSKWVDCEKDDVVLVQNATTGINVVLRSLEGIWQEGDRLAFIETSVYVIYLSPVSLMEGRLDVSGH
jgi:hypothetical protein